MGKYFHIKANGGIWNSQLAIDMSATDGDAAKTIPVSPSEVSQRIS